MGQTSSIPIDIEKGYKRDDNKNVAEVNNSSGFHLCEFHIPTISTIGYGLAGIIVSFMALLMCWKCCISAKFRALEHGFYAASRMSPGTMTRPGQRPADFEEDYDATTTYYDRASTIRALRQCLQMPQHPQTCQTIQTIPQYPIIIRQPRSLYEPRFMEINELEEFKPSAPKKPSKPSKPSKQAEKETLDEYLPSFSI